MVLHICVDQRLGKTGSGPFIHQRLIGILHEISPIQIHRPVDRTLKAEEGIIIHPHAARLTPLRRDEDDTARRTRTIDRCRSGILQDRDRLDIIGIHVPETRHNPVDQHQRLIVSQRPQSTYADLRLRARNTIELRHRHTRQCTLQGYRRVVHRTLHEFVTGDHRHRTRQIDLLLAAVTHHHHLIQLGIRGLHDQIHGSSRCRHTQHPVADNGNVQGVRR